MTLGRVLEDEMHMKRSSAMITPEEPENMILVIRMTSSGKSHFINMLAPRNEIREGHKPRPDQNGQPS